MRHTMMVIICFLILLVFVSFWGFYTAIHPFKIVSTLTPKNFGIAYEDISFRTKDNLLIRGWFIPNPNPEAKTIILLHGYPADKGDILPSRIFLHKEFNLLFFDFRYLGASEGSFSTFGKKEVDDLLAAINYLRSRHINSVGVWGFSMGGSVAIMAAKDAPEIQAIVAESPYARLDWLAADFYRIPLLRYPLGQLTRLWVWLFLHFDISQVNPVDVVSQLTIPILLIHSENDRVVPVRHAFLFEKELKNNPKSKVIIVKDIPHGGSLQDYNKLIEDFFMDHLAKRN